jgi:hypothetical protein
MQPSSKAEMRLSFQISKNFSEGLLDLRELVGRIGEHGGSRVQQVHAERLGVRLPAPCKFHVVRDSSAALTLT